MRRELNELEDEPLLIQATFEQEGMKMNSMYRRFHLVAKTAMHHKLC